MGMSMALIGCSPLEKTWWGQGSDGPPELMVALVSSEVMWYLILISITCGRASQEVNHEAHIHPPRQK